MNDISNKFAKELLEKRVVSLQPSAPFTWASGWLSPIYCDNRQTLSYPELRRFVCNSLAALVRTNFPQANAVAGVATGAIAQGVLVADALGLPFSYVRPKPKDHGKQNQIEGFIAPGSHIVVVEDLVSTGMSSLKAVEALRSAGHEVVGMVASFTYGFPEAENAFAAQQVPLFTLTDYNALLKAAVETGYISQDQLPVLSEWRRNPGAWGK